MDLVEAALPEDEESASELEEIPCRTKGKEPAVEEDEAEDEDEDEDDEEGEDV